MYRIYRDFLLRNDDGAVLTDVTADAGIENLTMGWGSVSWIMTMTATGISTW